MYVKQIAQLFILSFCLLLGLQAEAAVEVKQVIEGIVIDVYNGDILTVRESNGEKIKVSLYGIDAPEKAQPFGRRAHLMLFDQTLGQPVILHIIGLCRKNRPRECVAEVEVSNRIINLDMVEEGFAECYVEHSKEPFTSRCLELEAAARDRKLGVWSLPNYERPSDYRKNIRENKGRY